MLQEGKELRIEVDSANILYATTCSLSITKELNQVVHKDTPGTGNFATYTADGATSATLNHSGLLGTDSAVVAFFNALKNGTSIAWKFKSSEAGSAEWAGNGFFNSQNVEANVSNTPTLEMGIQVSGEFTCTTSV